MKQLNPQAQKILDILADGCWHCGIDWGYADGHTKRITDITRFIAPTRTIKSEWCDCGRHTAKVLKRKIVSQGGQTESRSAHNQEIVGSIPTPATKLNPIAAEFLKRWSKPVEKINQAQLF